MRPHIHSFLRHFGDSASFSAALHEQRLKARCSSGDEKILVAREQSVGIQVVSSWPSGLVGSTCDGGKSWSQLELECATPATFSATALVHLSANLNTVHGSSLRPPMHSKTYLTCCQKKIPSTHEIISFRSPTVPIDSFEQIYPSL
jgi:hypothetical protein